MVNQLRIKGQKNVLRYACISKDKDKRISKDIQALVLFWNAFAKKWTFGSGSLKIRRRCGETAWKRKRIETSLEIVISMFSI